MDMFTDIEKLITTIGNVITNTFLVASIFLGSLLFVLSSPEFLQDVDLDKFEHYRPWAALALYISSIVLILKLILWFVDTIVKPFINKKQAKNKDKEDFKILIRDGCIANEEMELLQLLIQRPNIFKQQVPDYYNNCIQRLRELKILNWYSPRKRNRWVFGDQLRTPSTEEKMATVIIRPTWFFDKDVIATISEAKG